MSADIFDRIEGAPAFNGFPNMPKDHYAWRCPQCDVGDIGVWRAAFCWNCGTRDVEPFYAKRQNPPPVWGSWFGVVA